MRRRFLIAGWLAWLGFASLSGATAPSEGLEFFESKIRPLLVGRCLECHGEKKQKGGLRLDSRAAWQAGGDSGAPLVAGDPEASLLIKAVRYGDKDLQMPPKHPLAPAEVAALEQWIKIGAPDPRDPGHSQPVSSAPKTWAFQPIGHPQPPVGEAPQEIDRFIQARLAQAGLHPSPPADRRTLIRRVTFDLTGLPPTMPEVEAFERDASPDAFAKVVDRLLASPAYGEQWARHWLDVARYSDTKGYVYAREERHFVHAWAYRDWVVRALNDDLPYNRFLELQIAADQLAPAGSPHLAAMGFLTLGRRFLGVTHDIIDDRIDVLMRGTQGLTVACARCHDHKFDPIATRDYYALYGVFQSCAEQVVSCGPATGEGYAKELATREQKLRETLARRREEQSARVRSTVKEHLLAQLELEKYPEEVFGQLLGVADINPVFVRRWQAFLARDEKRAQPIFREWHELRPQGSSQALQESATRYGALFTEIEKQWRDLLAREPGATALPDRESEKLRRVLYGPDSPCEVPDEHIANIELFFPVSVVEELWKLQGEVDRWLLQRDDAPPQATILVDRAQPATPRIFVRGNPLRKGDEVPRAFLAALSPPGAPPFTQGSGRLELAHAIANAENPLTARVIVNRVWMHHFGRGLVSTPSDFGKQGSPPSHPELLDWLARRFMDAGWSMKALHRLILLSDTYRQSSVAQPDDLLVRKAQETDPENRLLWRMNSHRLSFEEMRDAWLASAGELSPRVGGKPLELFAPENARRTLYAKVDRERLPAVMRTFDFANPDLSIPQRNDTIVPQQALFGLNHPFLAARAKTLAHRTEAPGQSDARRLEQIYALLFQRRPTAEERETALAFLGPAPVLTQAPEKPNAWQYGYGEWDEDAARVKSFTPLPYFSGTAWQGGEQWPDRKLGWAQLTATGGHPGNDRGHAVVRRWTAPQDGTYAIASTLIHEPAAGDGIRAFIAHSRLGLLRSATLHHATATLDCDPLPMAAGETIDFIVDIGVGLNNDQFLWAPKIVSLAATGAGSEDPARSWDAQAEFRGPSTAQLTPWEQLAQVLLLSNEFTFLD